jgi:hypothetical protein
MEMVQMKKITIGVLPKKRDDTFTFNDLELFHEECGGRISLETAGPREWDFECARCAITGHFWADCGMTAAVIQTAIDGKPRTTSLDEKYYDVYEIVRKA